MYSKAVMLTRVNKARTVKAKAKHYQGQSQCHSPKAKTKAFP